MNPSSHLRNKAGTAPNTAAWADGTDLVFEFVGGASVRLQNVFTVDDGGLVTGFRGVGGDAELAESVRGDGGMAHWLDVLDYSYPNIDIA